MHTIFYSWQSSLDEYVCKRLLGEVLNRVAKTINRDKTEYELVIDRDASGVPGSPNIADTIFAKIDNADIFVADVSIINVPQAGVRAMPNPNVLIEVGYAFGVLGESRVLMLMNTAFNIPEENRESPKNILPFDLGLKRVTSYELSSRDDPRKVEVRETLVGRLAHQITEMLAFPRTDKRIRKLLEDVPKVSFVTGGGSSSGGGKQRGDATLICTQGTARMITLGSNQGQAKMIDWINPSRTTQMAFDFPNTNAAIELYAEFSDEFGYEFRLEQTFEWRAPAQPKLMPGLAMFKRDSQGKWEKMHDSRMPKA